MIDPISSSQPSNAINWDEALENFDYAEAAEKFEALMAEEGGLNPENLTTEDQGQLFYLNLYQDVLRDGIRRSGDFADELENIYKEAERRNA